LKENDTGSTGIRDDMVGLENFMIMKS